jgi:CrcB protein
VTTFGWVAFVVAAAVGAPLRYVVDTAVARRVAGVFPWGTWVVNTTGSFLFGVVTGLALHHGLSDTAKLVIGTGFCGAYTTFSTFSYETVRLVEDGAYDVAVRNALGTFLAGAAAAAAGLAVTAL